MSGLREYRVPAPGGQTITVQLSDEDAKRYGDNAVPVVVEGSVVPEVKASTAKSTKARTPANKSAAVETKAADADGSGE